MPDVRLEGDRQAISESGRPVVEIVLLALREASVENFDVVMRDAIKHLRSAPGYIEHTYGPCVEDVGVFVLMVWWRSVESHVVEFRLSPQHAQWRSLLQNHLKSEPWVRHFAVPQGANA